MSLFFKPAETRSIDDTWPSDFAHGGTIGSALDSSLSLIPVYASTRLIADSVASLPLQQYRKTGATRSPMPLASVMAEPSVLGTRVDWLHRCMTSLLLRGNAYGLIVRSNVAPSEVVWLHPDKVRVEGDTAATARYLYNGRQIDTVDMLHIPAYTLPGSLVGVSPVQAAALTLDAGARSQRFMRDWFANSATPSAHFKNTAKTLQPGEAEAISSRFKAKIRAGEPLVTGSDWDYSPLTLSAADAGFLAMTKATATQVAAIFGVPPEMVGGETGSSMTYSTVEMNAINFVTYTLRPWLTRLEAAFSKALIPSPQYVKFNVDAMIRTDIKTRHDVYKIDREIGLRSIDEERALEDLEPLPDGQGESFVALSAKPASKETAT